MQEDRGGSNTRRRKSHDNRIIVDNRARKQRLRGGTAGGLQNRTKTKKFKIASSTFSKVTGGLGSGGGGKSDEVGLLLDESPSEDEKNGKGDPKKRRVRKRQITPSDDEMFSVTAHTIIYFCCSLPLAALAICVLLALLLHFKQSTQTHCGVANYLPSISAAIAESAPEMVIWRVCIALHCLPRFASAFIYKNFYWSSPLRPLHSLESHWFWALCVLLCFMHVCENMFLVLLTFISSIENHHLHKLSFGLFVICSLCYMALTLYLFDVSGRRRASSLGEKSFQHKLVTFSLAIASLTLSAYFYYRHNTYCEPGVYTLFAACEYVYVVSNVMFHASMHYDLNDKKLALVTLQHYSFESLLAASNRGQPITNTVVGDWKAT